MTVAKIANIGQLRQSVGCIIITTVIIIIVVMWSQWNSLSNNHVLSPVIDVDELAECAPRDGDEFLSSRDSNDQEQYQEQCVSEYLSEYERDCHRLMVPKKKGSSEVDIEDTTVKLCPCVPTVLCGFSDIAENLTNEVFDDDGGTFTMTNVQSSTDDLVEAGGRWRPNWCLPRQRIAIIVPFRNRESHLRVFLRHMRSVLRRQLLDFTIFVVEQLQREMFNRGSLINVGFIEAKSRAVFDCYFFHDVDMLPLDDRDFYTCSTSPRHVAAYQKHRKNRLSYDCYFGGIQAFTGEQFTKINGYSNMFYGWGGEDDDLLRRVWAQNFTVSLRRPMCVSRFGMIKHSRDVGNHQGRHQHLGQLWRPHYYQLDGLNNIQYKVISLDERKLYTRIRVQLPEFDNATVTRQFERDSNSSTTINIDSCRLNGLPPMH